MVGGVIKQSFRQFVKKHALASDSVDTDASSVVTDEDDYVPGLIRDVELESGYQSSPRARQKFMRIRPAPLARGRLLRDAPATCHLPNRLRASFRATAARPGMKQIHPR